MQKKHNRRPSPALVVAMLALFAALGGTSYAAATGSIDSREIKNSTVRGNDIRNGTVTGTDVKNGSLTKSDFKAGQLASGTRGDTGPQGAAGPQGQTGSAGESGPAAYAEIGSTGQVDNGSPSRGITDSSVSRPVAGTYCFDLGFKPSTAMVGPNPEGAAAPDDSVVYFDLDPNSYVVCPDAAEAEVTNLDISANQFQNDDLNVRFDR